MRTVTALDLRTGAAIVLLATASCVVARPSDPKLEANNVDPQKIEPIGDVPAGAVVFVEWAGRWAKMVLR
jgi:hypothetical protein